MTVYDFCRGYTHRPFRTAPIQVLTIHSLQGGKSTVESIDEWYQERIAQGFSSCSNYGVAYDGKIGIYVPDARRAATSSSSTNDNRALTIEVATDTDAPKYSMYDAARTALVDLIVELCSRYKKQGIVMMTKETRFDAPPDGYFGITLHRWYADTDCPGDDILKALPEIVKTVNARLTPIYRVQVGAYINRDNADVKLRKVRDAGFKDAYITV